MEESKLPDAIRSKASVTAGGEHAWRMDDVPEVIHAARDMGFACLGGQLQFQFTDGTCEAYWISFDPTDRRLGEPWPDYVLRSAEETLSAFRRICRETDVRKVASEWDFIQRKIDREGCDPRDYLWFTLYFQAEPGRPNPPLEADG
jgi:hypothetical protein